MISFEQLQGATVCICAPTRSATHVAELERQLGLAGASVLAPVPPGAGLSPLQRAALSALHERKIEQADVVVVANPDGYAGSGTAAEIAHAARLGKPVMFLHDPPSLAVDGETYAGLIGRTRSLELRPGHYLPRDLAAGSVIAVCAPGDPEGRAAWFRVTEQLRYASRAEALAAIDSARAVPGIDADVLAALLEARYPGTAAAGHEVLDLEFIAEPAQIRTSEPQAPSRPSVVLLVRADEDRLVLLGPPSQPRLPGGAIAEGEYPTDAAMRCAREQLGLTEAPLLRLVVLDTGASGQGGVTATFVFDTGTLKEEYCETVRTNAVSATGGCVFAAHDEALARVHGRAARWLRAAFVSEQAHDRLAPRAIGSHSVDPQGRVVFSDFIDVDGPLVRLEDGIVPGARLAWEWHEQLPEGVPVTQAGVWAFDQDGRVLLQHRVDAGRFALPAGSPEEKDRDLLASAAREAFEESQILIDQRRAALLGYQVTYGNPAYPNGQAQARFAAPVLAYYPIAPDTDPALKGGRLPYRRYLVDIRRAAALLDWGPHAEMQTRAAEQAAREIGVPVDRPAADGYRDHGDAHLPEIAPEWELVL